MVLSGCLNSRGLLPGYSAAQKKRAGENLELLGIADLKNRSFQELSGGQRQRVLLARSLCCLLYTSRPVQQKETAPEGFGNEALFGKGLRAW